MIKSVIIVAAGSGSRMGSDVPKQFMLLKNLPIIMHTINRFYSYDPEIRIIMVLSANDIERWNTLKREFNFTVKHEVVTGGKTRTASVINGLNKIENGIVGIHDGVRPLASTALITTCFNQAMIHSNAIPAIAVVDTIRETNGELSKQIDRANLRQVQTPQCFDAVKLKEAYLHSSGKSFTDDAGVFEAAGNKIHLIEGEKMNIKITDRVDLLIADAIFFSL